MKTEQEIRERIAEYQRSIDKEVEYGAEEGEDWTKAVTAQGALKWVLDEVTEKERA